MAAGDTTQIARVGTQFKTAVELWRVISKSTTGAVIYTTLKLVQNVSLAWAESPGSGTVLYYEYSETDGTVTVKSSGNTDNKKVDVRIEGY